MNENASVMNEEEQVDEPKLPIINQSITPNPGGLWNSRYKDEYAQYLHIDGYDIDENMWEEIPLIESTEEDEIVKSLQSKHIVKVVKNGIKVRQYRK